MTLDQEQPPVLSLTLKDVAQPFWCTHLRLVYSGEVIVADRWDREWGSPLEGRESFRLVLLQARQSVSLDEVKDARIAVCSPDSNLRRSLEEMGRETRSVRDGLARYGPPYNRQRIAVDRVLEQREEELRNQWTALAARQYRQGRVLSQTAAEFIDPLKVFQGAELEAWCRSLACGLLAFAYPTLPILPDLLPRPVLSTDGPAVLRAVLGENGAFGAIIEELGPGLGLSTQASPRTLDPAGCPVFRVIEGLLEAGGGAVSWESVLGSLSHAYGLTRPLAQMFLISFLFRGGPEVELLLHPSHRLRLVSGQNFVSDRVVREVAPLVDWPEELAGRVQGLGAPTAISWLGTFPYIFLIAPELERIQDQDPSEREELLRRALTRLSERLEACEETLRELGSFLTNPKAEEVVASLSRLRELCGSGAAAEVYQRARRDFGSPGRLTHRLEMLDNIEGLRAFLDDLNLAAVYLDASEGAPGFDQLSLYRIGLLAQLTLPNLVGSGAAATSFLAQFDRYREDYSRAYRAHHRDYHRGLPSLALRLEDAQFKLSALAHLDSISELGAPEAGGFEPQFAELTATLKPCGQSPEQLPLDLEARCPTCLIRLGQPLPETEADLLLRRLERALLAKGQALSRELTGRILEGRAGRRLDDFLKMVQASDLSALANTLDGDMARFIRRLVTSR